MSQKYVGFISPFMDLSKHLRVGTNVLINVSKLMASLRTKRNPAYINGLMVL